MSEAEERTARHLRMCQELAELGMAMAHALARKTLEQMAEPETGPKPGRPQTDPALTFARLSTSVRQAIALEARIAAGPALPRYRSAPRRHAPPPRPAPPPPIAAPVTEPSVGLGAENPYPSLLQTLYQDLRDGFVSEDAPDGSPIDPAWTPPLTPHCTGPPL